MKNLRSISILNNYYHKIKKINFFVIGFICFFIVLFTIPSQSQTTDFSPRKELISEIKEYAKRHLESDNPMATETVVNVLYPENQAKMTRAEIGEIYEIEYIKLKNKQDANLWKKIQKEIFYDLSWFPAFLMLIIFIFRDLVVEIFSNIVNKIYTFIWDKINNISQANRFLRRNSIKKYRDKIIDRYRINKITYLDNFPLNIEDIFVPLKISNNQEFEDKSENEQKVSIEEVIGEHHQSIVLGLPGSGKSLFMKYVSLKCAKQELECLGKKTYIPVLLELYKFKEEDNKDLIDYIVDIFKSNEFNNPEKFIENSLKEDNLLILLDGLDEVRRDIRSSVVDKIKEFIENYPSCRLVITCRTAVYNDYKEVFSPMDFKTFEVAELEDKEIEQFLNNYQRYIPKEKSIEHLTTILNDKPNIKRDARNPLILTIIIYLYIRENSQLFISLNLRADFYKKSINIFFEKNYRGRDDFRTEDKKLILQHLAFYLQTNSQKSQTQRSIYYKEAESEVNQILPNINAGDILQEIVKNNGLLLYIRGEYIYMFTHLTFQEFFAAEKLYRDGDSQEVINLFKNDPNTWRETVKLWCGLVEDSTFLIKEIDKKDRNLAFECLENAQHVDNNLAQKIINHFISQLGINSNIEIIFGAVISQNNSFGNKIFEILENIVKKDRNIKKRTAAANILASSNLPEAASFLATRYFQPEVKEALKNMGDIAIEELVKLAEKDSESDSVLVALGEIGTQNAINQIVSLLWNGSSNIQIKAAWRLAVLLKETNVEKILKKYPIKNQQRPEKSMIWIWEPFDESNNSSVSIIASRVAYLISKSKVEEIPKQPLKLDPRLVIPLYSINDLGIQESLRNYLLNSLDNQIKKDLNKRLEKPNINITKNDWINVKKNAEYTFQNSWEYITIWMIFIILSMLCFWYLFSAYFGLNIWINIVIIFLLIFYLVGMIFAFKQPNILYLLWWPLYALVHLIKWIFSKIL